MSHVTLHLWRVRPPAVPAAVTRMATDRVRLRAVRGLGFHKLLGTGDGRTFRPGDADPSTWGLLAVWADPLAADAFEAGPTARGWRRIAVEEWRADLACLRTRGRWSGRTPFAPDPDLAGWDGAIASVTRARLRPTRMRSFWRAVPPVVDDLDAGARPLVQVGIGEAPVGLQGTVTVWRDEDALRAFAHRRRPHRAAIADTHRLGWYAEELFARFAVLAQRGTLHGRALPLPTGARAVPAIAGGR